MPYALLLVGIFVAMEPYYIYFRCFLNFIKLLTYVKGIYVALGHFPTCDVC